MRTLRLSLAGTVILTLLGGLGGVALAQTTDEESLDPMRASSFTGAWSAIGAGSEGEWHEGPGCRDWLGKESVAMVVRASDPRISGKWTQVLNRRFFPVDMEADIWVGVGTAAVRIENEDGAWAGTYDDAASEWNRLTGEGAYEGLTAVFRWVEEGSALEGVIIPGVPPDYPDPIAAETKARTETAASDTTEEVVLEDDEAEPLEPSRTSGAPGPSAGCGTASATAGTSQDSMEIADLVRSWYAHVPTAHDGQTPLPLVIQLHGNGGWAALQADLSGLDGLGDEMGFVTVTPEGRGQVQRWIYEFDERGWDVTPTNPDVLFIGALIDHLGHQLCLDLARVYVTGMSNGGQAATALACVLDERIAAIAPVAGLVNSGDDCNTARPVPMLAFYGQEDPIAPFEGGMIPILAEAPSEVGTPYGDLPMAVAFEGLVTDRGAGIAKRYGCAPGPTTELVAEHVERIRYACPDGADVALVVATDGGHAWPGAPFPPEVQPVELQGHVNMEIDASRMMWDFFAQHALPAE